MNRLYRPSKAALIPVVILLILLCMGLFSHSAKAQRRRGIARTSGSQAPQWQMGFKAGLTLGHADTEQLYSVFGNTAFASRPDDFKTYDGSFARVGSQVGLEIAFNVTNSITLSLQPGFYTYGYAYNSEYEWALNDDGSQSTRLDLRHEHTLSYLEAPLLLRYYFGRNKIRPYIQGGAYLSRLQQATKELDTQLEDNTAGGSEPLSVQTTETIGIEDLYIRAQAGWIAGGGVAFDLGHVPDNSSSNLGIVRFLFNVNYRQGFHNIVDVRERFVDRPLLSGVYDAQDDLSLANIEISITCLFTFKYDFL